MPYLRARNMQIDWREIWDYADANVEIEKAANEFLRYDDLTTQRELALMGE